MSYQCIEATQQDVTTVVNLGKDMLSQSIDVLKRHCRTLLEVIHELVRTKHAEAKAFQEGIEFWQVTFTRKELQDRSKWSRWHLEEHLEELEQAGYVAKRIGKRGQRFSYSLVEETIPIAPEVNL
jgi:hypothetical protein